MCRKAVDYIADRLPAAKSEKLGFLCSSEAVGCLSQHLDKCHAFHDSVLDLQSQWICEAEACSAQGSDCQRAVEFLDMDDQQLSADQRLQKTRFLCSDAGLQCISEHKDTCLSAFEIVSMAHDLRHCDRVRCSDAGEGCKRAVNYVTQDDLGNLTHRKVAESQEKWDYLCSDEALKCLAANVDKCQRYHDFLKGAFGHGQCSFIQCAKAGLDCKKAVKYLSQEATQISEQEKAEKHSFLCGPSAAECLQDHEECAPYKEMLTQTKEEECVTKPVVKATIPPTAEILDARSDAARAAAEAIVKAKTGPFTAKQAAEEAAEELAKKEEEEDEQRVIARAKALEEGNSGLHLGSQEEGSKTAEDEHNKQAWQKAGARVGSVGALALLVAGGMYWRRRRKPSGKGPSKPLERGVPPKPKKPKLPRSRRKAGEASSEEKDEKEEKDEQDEDKSPGMLARFRKYANLASFSRLARRLSLSKKEEADDEKKEAKPDEGVVKADAPATEDAPPAENVPAEGGGQASGSADEKPPTGTEEIAEASEAPRAPEPAAKPTAAGAGEAPAAEEAEPVEY